MAKKQGEIKVKIRHFLLGLALIGVLLGALAVADTSSRANSAQAEKFSLASILPADKLITIPLSQGIVNCVVERKADLAGKPAWVITFQERMPIAQNVESMVLTEMPDYWDGQLPPDGISHPVCTWMDFAAPDPDWLRVNYPGKDTKIWFPFMLPAG